MPRPNKPRSIFNEESLARRIAYEREARGWSPQGLASRMENLGCPIQVSAIYKIEKADPPRRITVAELIGFSQAFGISVEDMLLPPELVAKQELVSLITTWDSARVEAVRTQDVADEAWGHLQEFVRSHPELEADVESAMGAWLDYYGNTDDTDREWMLDHKVAELTGDRSRKERAAAKFHEVIG